MNKTEKIVLGLAAAVALVLSAGVAYAMSAQPHYQQGTYTGVPTGSGIYGGGMMGGGTYSGGMMGGSSYGGGMMGGFGSIAGGVSSMMSRMTPYMSSFWNQTRSGSQAGFVAIVDYSFYPTNITVSRGTTVTWVNMDFVQHTVTSGTDQAPAGLFDSHELSHMQGFSYTFNADGTYTYYCDLHPNMIGTVTVTG